MRKILLLSLTLALLVSACAGGGNEGGAAGGARLGASAAIRMTTPRADQTATDLGGGRILIAGGTRNDQFGGVLASAEIFDLPTGFSATESMSRPREGNTATLLRNGKVLIAGGVRNIGFREAMAGAELFDPATGTFSPTGRMTTARQGHTATLLLDGKVLIVGGRGNGNLSLRGAELYDPSNGTFTATDPMMYAREAHTATLLRDGKVLIAGGAFAGVAGGYLALSRLELYDPASGTFISLSRMTVGRFGHTATLLKDGRVLLAGGHGGHLTGIGRNIARAFLTSLASADIFDSATGAARRTGSMKIPHYLHTATLLENGTVLIAGGWNSAGPAAVGMTDAELYDPATGTFARTGSLTVPRLDHTATLLPNGTVLVAGGVNGDAKVVADCEFYDPSSGSFVATIPRSMQPPASEPAAPAGGK